MPVTNVVPPVSLITSELTSSTNSEENIEENVNSIIGMYKFKYW